LNGDNDNDNDNDDDDLDDDDDDNDDKRFLVTGNVRVLSILYIA